MTYFTRILFSSTAMIGLAAGAAQADQVFLDDVIVDGSLCVGFDCVNGESFGFDTIRLKENNLRIKFDDTSTAASYPRNDWQLTANDSANGGANKFSIDDISGNRTPFTIEANARSHALYVDDGGRIGSRTSTPSTEIHTVDGDTPTLRLQQDGSSGFAPQTWDVAGNETNFFIRDVTNGSTLPFRIRPGAPTSSIFIDTDGDVGLGDSSPDASLDVEGSDGTTKLRVEETSGTSGARTVAEFINNGRPDMVLANTSTSKEWSIGGGTNMVFKSGALGSDPGSKTTRFTLFEDGDATLTGTLTTGGTTCGGGCDLVFSDDYDLPSVQEHAEKMFALGHLPNVGPTIENAPINVSDKLGRMLNELEHAHIYIAQQDERLSQQDDRIARQDAQIADLSETVKALQALLDQN
ncbi:hypothetical protein [Marimonas arenosa]|uniref:Uncharacterized protein n=1 Tax=Marimonas arenosa TaxID=1795305 RepID=A0AAE3WFQ9_9RHOB|nr:hypothetical protein [Marimonas arenosa]MDQ2092201.1 hypothetical protein [Marimonas arenosa]